MSAHSDENSDAQLDALFAAARIATPATDRVEFAFETRLAARLRAERQSPSFFALAWRLSPIFAALALATAWWSHQAQAAGDPAFFVEAASANEEQMLALYLTGERP